jgi:hypothetical protein
MWKNSTIGKKIRYGCPGAIFFQYSRGFKQVEEGSFRDLTQGRKI